MICFNRFLINIYYFSSLHFRLECLRSDEKIAGEDEEQLSAQFMNTKLKTREAFKKHMTNIITDIIEIERRLDELQN